MLLCAWFLFQRFCSCSNVFWTLRDHCGGGKLINRHNKTYEVDFFSFFRLQRQAKSIFQDIGVFFFFLPDDGFCLHCLQLIHAELEVLFSICSFQRLK